MPGATVFGSGDSQRGLRSFEAMLQILSQTAFIAAALSDIRH
jgi:hypothetical protein